MDESFGHWLAGFVDGEGCFTITPNRPGYLCRLTVSLRCDDEPILREIQRQTGVGRVKARRASRSDGANRLPQTMWRVQKKAECVEVVRLFDRFPLRAKKARDFAIWRRAVLAMMVMGRPRSLGRGGIEPHDWAEVEMLKAALDEVRLPGSSGEALLLGSLEAGAPRLFGA